MALDFDRLRKHFDNLQGRNNRSAAIFKPKPGKTIIRIVPWKDNPDYPFIELYFHYLGGKTQLSPLTKGKPDPIAEFGEKLKAEKLRELASAGGGSKEDWAAIMEEVKPFLPKVRVFAPVIVRGEEEQGVRFWGFSPTIAKKLVGIILDQDWGDLSHVQTGRDIVLEFVAQKDSDTNYAKTDFSVKPNQTPASTDAELLKKWLTVQPDLYEVFPMPTYESLAEFLTKFLDPDNDKLSVTATSRAPGAAVSAATEAVAAPQPTKAATPAPATVTATVTATVVEEEVAKVDDVEAEFAKLFNA